MKKPLHQDNRLSWNAATLAHNSHKKNQAQFFREGGSTLFDEELDLLGNLQGKTVLHLQCNSGQDTLSLALQGAIVTGIDISDSAISFANRLAKESKISASFIRADLYDWFAENSASDNKFDIIFCSYGSICWMSDLALWGKGVAQALAKGGRFVIVDFHPILMMMEDCESHPIQIKYPYSSHGKENTDTIGVPDYVQLSGESLAHSGYEEGITDFRNTHTCHDFSWGIADIIGSLLNAGLVVTSFDEYDFCNGCAMLNTMRDIGNRRFALHQDVPPFPLMYSVVARKP